MAEEIIYGVFRAIQGLAILGVGCLLYSTAKWLVERDGEKTGMPKWKASLLVPVVAAALGLFAATPSVVTENGDPLFGGGDVVEVQEVQSPHKEFTKTFVFTGVVMWCGVAKSFKF